jgi:hypothetical protein
MKTNDGRLIVVSGASRCGKSTQVARMAKSARRIAAWDPEAQWCDLPGWRKVTTRQQLLDAIMTKGHVRLAYVAGGDLKEEFNFLCGCVMYAGRYVAPLDFVAEELADVTSTSKAPAKWGILVRRGLKRGINIYAISQRWAEADKTAIGNCSAFLVFASRGDDVMYMAKKTGIPVDEIAALKALEYITFDPVTKEKTKKKLTFSR